MIHVTIEEYDLTVRKPPFKFKKVGEFNFKKSILDQYPSDCAMHVVLKRQLENRGFCFMSGKEYRFWTSGETTDHVTAVVGNAEELAKLDYDAQYA